jgi:hypothetical protein
MFGGREDLLLWSGSSSLALALVLRRNSLGRDGLFDGVEPTSFLPFSFRLSLPSRADPSPSLQRPLRFPIPPPHPLPLLFTLPHKPVALPLHPIVEHALPFLPAWRRLVYEDDLALAAVWPGDGRGLGVNGSGELFNEAFEAVDLEGGAEDKEEVGRSRDIVKLKSADEVTVWMVLVVEDDGRAKTALSERSSASRDSLVDW